MRFAFVVAPLLLLGACTDPPQEAQQAVAGPTAVEEAAPAPPAAAPDQTSGVTMTAADPGGFTEEGFVLLKFWSVCTRSTWRSVHCHAQWQVPAAAERTVQLTSHKQVTAVLTLK